MCVICHWVSADSWQLDEWVTSTISCPQQPGSAPAHAHPWLLLWRPSTSSLVTSLLLPSVSPSIVIVYKEPCPLRMCLKYHSFSFVIFFFFFLLQQCFRLNLLRTHVQFPNIPFHKCAYLSQHWWVCICCLAHGSIYLPIHSINTCVPTMCHALS